MAAQPLLGQGLLPVIGVEAPGVGFDKALLPCVPCCQGDELLKQVRPYLVKANLCVTQAGICSSVQKQLKFALFSSLCLSSAKLSLGTRALWLRRVEVVVL